MKIFLSYGHDSNAPLIEKIKEYLSEDAMLKLYIICIKPRTKLPSDMKKNYHFGEI